MPRLADRHKAALLALATVAAVAALALAGRALNGPVALSEGEGAVGVRVVAPGEDVLFDGSVTLENPTAYSVLVAASETAGFDVKARDYQGLGKYVYSVGGHEARGSEGWVYGVVRDGVTVNGDRAADRFPVSPGELVEWRWSTAGG